MTQLYDRKSEHPGREGMLSYYRAKGNPEHWCWPVASARAGKTGWMLLAFALFQLSHLTSSRWSSSRDDPAQAETGVPMLPAANSAPLEGSNGEGKTQVHGGQPLGATPMMECWPPGACGPRKPFPQRMMLRGSSDGKESVCNAEGPGSIPGWGRSPGEGNGNALQYFCLENPVDRGAWWATVHGVPKNQT